MNPNIKILQDELKKPEYADLTYQAIANLLNEKPLIPNPVPPQQVQRFPNIIELLEAVTVQERVAITSIPTLFTTIQNAVRGRDAESLAACKLIADGLLSEESRGAIAPLLSQTEPDPNYQNQIQGQSKAELLGIYPVTAAQVQEVLVDAL